VRNKLYQLQSKQVDLKDEIEEATKTLKSKRAKYKTAVTNASTTSSSAVSYENSTLENEEIPMLKKQLESLEAQNKKIEADVTISKDMIKTSKGIVTCCIMYQLYRIFK